ncbi:MAG TPA: hypothetical protein VF733_00230 [Candidatus Saccharimonadales bacterium]
MIHNTEPRPGAEVTLFEDLPSGDNVGNAKNPFARLIDAITDHIDATALPSQRSAINGERGIFYDPGAAPLYGNARDFLHVMDQVQYNPIHDHPATVAIVEADSFTTPLLDRIPARTVIVTGRNTATHDWQEHEWDMICAHKSPREFQNNLWGDTQIHRDLEAVNRSKESVMAELTNEAILLGTEHHLRSQERYDSIRAMLLGEHPKQKNVIRLPFDIKKTGFQKWVDEKLTTNRLVVSFANLGNTGDREFSLVVMALKKLPLLEQHVNYPTQVIRSTQAVNSGSPIGTMEYHRDPAAEYHPHMQDALAGLVRSGMSFGLI